MQHVADREPLGAGLRRCHGDGREANRR